MPPLVSPTHTGCRPSVPAPRRQAGDSLDRSEYAPCVPSDADCLFCKIVAGDLPGTIIDSDERTVSFMDTFPVTRGHALVVPRLHARDLHDIGREDLAAVMLTAQRLAGRARDALKADGVNILNFCGRAAWQTVFHFHLHMIPRYDDDSLRLQWVPGPGDPGEIAAAAKLLKVDD